MNYHHRYSADNTCEIICTRCFSTIGVVKEPAAAREIEAQHACGSKAGQSCEIGTTFFFVQAVPPVSNVPPSWWNWRGKVLDFWARLEEWHVSLLLVFVALFFYVLPTTIEFWATRYWGAWLGSVFLGDILGCIGMAIILHMRRTAVVFYLLLTSVEAYLYTTHLIPANVLIWLVDLIPTLIILSVIVCQHSVSLRRPGDLL